MIASLYGPSLWASSRAKAFGGAATSMRYMLRQGSGLMPTGETHRAGGDLSGEPRGVLTHS